MQAIIVGAGVSGLTAGVLLKRAGWKVRVFETNAHLGGCCHDEILEGYHVHKYGPHIFHTKHSDVHEFLSGFTTFTDYEHRVLARTSTYPHLLLPLPYCKKTEEMVGKRLTDDEIREVFFVEYSEKMWGIPWSELPESIRTRVPKRRETDDDRYFSTPWQGMPDKGYADMFSRMGAEIGLSNVELSCNLHDWRAHSKKANLVVYTGSLDEYHSMVLGPLPYRSLLLQFGFDFEGSRQPVAVINEDNTDPITRRADYTRFYKEPADPDHVTQFVPVSTERPVSWHEGLVRYYPMRWGEGEKLCKEYERLTTVGPRTLFCGRLGTYQYLDIDAAVHDAMQKVRSFLRQRE